MSNPQGADPSAADRASTIPMIKVESVSKLYGNIVALDDVSLDVRGGEVVAIIGPSGSGKSTLCRCINRLESIDRGTIEIDGTPLPSGGRRLAAMRAEVAMVFQTFNLFPHMTILDNITIAPIKVKGVPPREARDLAHQLLERVGIASQAKKHPNQLSGGQQQRAAIARALAMKPKALLFDEPTSALDPEAIKEVLDVMDELADSGMTMVVVTHEMGFARSAADRIIFMDAGRIVDENTAEEFFTAPKTKRAEAFISKLNAHALRD